MCKSGPWLSYLLISVNDCSFENYLGSGASAKEIEIGGAQLQEIFFGWLNLERLALSVLASERTRLS
jgi:hypothetical protein